MPYAMPIFGKSRKTSAELVDSLKEAVMLLESGTESNLQKAQKDINQNLVCIKELIAAGDQTQPSTEQALEQIAQKFRSHNLFLLLIQKLSFINFESKKHLVVIFNVMLQETIGGRHPTVEYISFNPQILFTLLAGYEENYLEICQNTGHMLRACVYHETLAKILLHSENFFKLFDYVNAPTFDTSTDAFWTLKDLLTRHKSLGVEFLETNFQKFFIQHYNCLLQSENYAVRRGSIEFLLVLFFNKNYYEIMKQYISLPENLRIIMNLLKSRFPRIQRKALHIFMMFVSNPNKPKPILDILLNNQSKLIEFLCGFLKEQTTEEDFEGDCALLVQQIKNLKPILPLDH